MKLGKRVRSAIEGDFAPDMAVLVIAKIGMPALIKAYQTWGNAGVRLLVVTAMSMTGADNSEIDAVSALVEQTVSESVLIPAGTSQGSNYSIFLDEN